MNFMEQLLTRRTVRHEEELKKNCEYDLSVEENLPVDTYFKLIKSSRCNTDRKTLETSQNIFKLE